MKVYLRAATALLGLMLTGCMHTNGVVNLSHYDTMEPHFSAIRRAGVQAVIHEATFPPGAVDPEYAGRQVAATRAGLLWGAYHFGNASDPIRQADQLVDFTGRMAREDRPLAGVLLVLDFEQNTHYPGGTMSVPQAIAFIQRVHQRTGHYPGLYSNENRVRQVLGSPALSEAARAALRESWLWIANYHHVPEETGPWPRWTMWQYTGDGVCDLPRGSYPISVANIHHAERNLYNGSRSDLVHFWREHAWRP